MDALEYNAVISTLFRFIPEAKDAYDAWDMPDDPLPYIVFSFLEQSFFTPIVNADDDPDVVRRIFEFLEQMALSRDTEVVNLVWISLFDRGPHDLGSSAKLLSGWDQRRRNSRCKRFTESLVAT